MGAIVHAVVTVSSVAAGMTWPLLPLLARAQGRSVAEVGLAAGLFLAMALAGAPVAAGACDRWGAPRVLAASLLLRAAVMAAYPLSSGPAGFFALRLVDGLAVAGVLPPARALLLQATPPARHGHVLGTLTAAQTAAALLGPAAGGLLSSRAALDAAFAAAAALLALAAAVGLAVRVPGRVDTRPRAAAGRVPAGLVPLLAVRAALGIPQGVATAVWSPYLQDRGAPPAAVGLSYTLFALPSAFLAPWPGRWCDRGDPVAVLRAGMAASAATYAAYAAPVSPAAILLLSPLEGAAATLARVAADVLAARRTPPGGEARVQAACEAAGAAGRLLGSLAGGFLYGLSPAAPFAAEALAAVLSALAPVADRRAITPTRADPRRAVMEE